MKHDKKTVLKLYQNSKLKKIREKNQKKIKLLQLSLSKLKIHKTPASQPVKTNEQEETNLKNKLVNTDLVYVVLFVD